MEILARFYSPFSSRLVIFRHCLVTPYPPPKINGILILALTAVQLNTKLFWWGPGWIKVWFLLPITWDFCPYLYHKSGTEQYTNLPNQHIQLDTYTAKHLTHDTHKTEPFSFQQNNNTWHEEWNPSESNILFLPLQSHQQTRLRWHEIVCKWKHPQSISSPPE